MGETDYLRQTVTRACIEILAAASSDSPIALITTLALGLSTETDGLFDNVTSMIQLLTMSINRAQDFIKISSDVPLVPVLAPFVLVDVLQMVEKCMISQNCDRVVNIHPLVRANTAIILLLHPTLIPLATAAPCLSVVSSLLSIFIPIASPLSNHPCLIIVAPPSVPLFHLSTHPSPPTNVSSPRTHHSHPTRAP